MTFLADNPVSHLVGWSDSASIKVQAQRLAFLHSLLIDGGPLAGLGFFSGFSSLPDGCCSPGNSWFQDLPHACEHTV